MDDLSITVALIGALGVGSQWLAVRLHMPAIVFMLAAGVIAGPVLGLIDPEAAFGDMLKPIVAVAVAVILFEGGLTLNFAELRGADAVVRRLCSVGALVGWVLYTAACYYIAGLSFITSAVFGGLLVVTGPTVVIPLLRQARLARRPASALKWEAIINDPIGALLAVLAFEFAIASQDGESLAFVGGHLTLGILVASAVGYVAGRGVVWAFQRGHVAEFMKVPVLLVLVLAVYASTDFILHESGLLAVTVMGIVIANTRFPSLVEMRRFKENVTVLLVSGVFVLLAATIDAEMLRQLDWRSVLFVVVVIVLARPLAVWLALIGTDMPKREKLFVGWISPRGVVAVAIAGFFGTRLAEIGVADGERMAGLAFLVVAVTVVVSGFTMAPFGRWLGLSSDEIPGVLIVGSNEWTLGLAKTLRRAEVPVLVADRNWYKLGPARAVDIPTYHGEVLSEAAEHTIEVAQYGALVAASDNDDYNALVCTDLGPELGRDRVFQIGRHEMEEGEHHMPASIGGRTLLPSGAPYEMLELRMGRGWGFALTRIDEDFTEENYRDKRHDKAELVAMVRESGVVFTCEAADHEVQPGDRLITFTPEPDGAIDNAATPDTVEKSEPPIRTLAEKQEEAEEAAIAERREEDARKAREEPAE